ncbi:class I SAM-dependent methyltransferase [Jiella sp. M17.18]|uniref:class I SAM-dependent methyltransferase n=1 Tax=Jiella sp. M17.18 TaxID=3234247 RepID=UPI0034DF3020
MNDPRLRRHPLGFLEAADRPTPEGLAAYYSDVYYQTERGNYRREYSPLERDAIRLRIEQRSEQAIALLGRDRPGRLLDVGCGEGFVLKAFAERGWEVTGIDFSRTGVETMNPDMTSHVEQGDIFALLETRIAADESFDLVWLGNVLEHVLDPVGLLQALHRLVRPDGILVATVPNDGSGYQEALLEAGDIDHRFWIAIPDHLSYFSGESLRSTAEATGWETLALLADFPVDLFLAHPGSNYVADRSRGPAAHQARLRLERLIGAAGPERANRFYAALADVGLGRNLIAFLRPKPKDSAP